MVSVVAIWPNLSNNSAYVADFRSKGRARAATLQGGAGGSFTDDGMQRVVTLNLPLPYQLSTADCNGEATTQRVDTQQVVFRRLTGSRGKDSSAIIESGVITDIDGCTPGLVTPFGALTDRSATYNHLSMANQPPIADLVP